MAKSEKKKSFVLSTDLELLLAAARAMPGKVCWLHTTSEGVTLRSLGLGARCECDVPGESTQSVSADQPLEFRSSQLKEVLESMSRTQKRSEVQLRFEKDLVIECGQYKIKVKAQLLSHPPDQAPALSAASGTRVSAEDLAWSLSQTEPSRSREGISNDWTTGTVLDWNEDELTVSSTNRFQVSRARIPARTPTELPQQVVLSSGAPAALSSWLRGSDEAWLQVSSGEIHVTTRGAITVRGAVSLIDNLAGQTIDQILTRGQPAGWAQLHELTLWLAAVAALESEGVDSEQSSDLIERAAGLELVTRNSYGVGRTRLKLSTDEEQARLSAQRKAEGSEPEADTDREAREGWTEERLRLGVKAQLLEGLARRFDSNHPLEVLIGNGVVRLQQSGARTLQHLIAASQPRGL